ncbi:hypothetical protein EYF80_022109 [Liparis tanakae]|uniref:Uncharacterized protein n=1 Tax=Liparis tanakae TaxID=230148 RepID=A0A4Z2HQR8_9TELE|nr:hypothetical protein EYF80_022109 [Liparis tanakae]
MVLTKGEADQRGSRRARTETRLEVSLHGDGEQERRKGGAMDKERNTETGQENRERHVPV